MDNKPSKETIDLIKKLRGAGAPKIEPISSGTAETIKTTATATTIDAAASQLPEEPAKKQIRTLIMNGKILNNDALDRFIENLV